ncbi:putative membrane protein YesL [Gracilibacillus halotolerans]|uniref:Putative membrane protein YesL n=1 Tax=Gracilibacillus halotolerans TaxID=74386 RepID=A0A841RLX3_9BACI|nr:YesL family protein [Gracilibacillus halotolerans]MBB6513771.1 putative membrane protein YesL [Gracilibacillus halotolerans]
MNKLNVAFEWITKVAYLNLLWILFTILGAVFIGLFPATAATFAVVRKWITGYTDAPLFKTFWKEWKESLVQANILGYMIAVIGYILYLDFLFVTVSQTDFALLLTIPFLIISILFGLTSLYVFPVYVYFEMKPLQVFKNAFFIMLLNPFPTLIMAFGLFGIGFLLYQFQWMALFFSMSMFALALLMPAKRSFSKIADKKQNYKEATNV